MFNSKDEEIRELICENNELWFENTELKNKIFKAIDYIKEHKKHEYRNGNCNEYYLELNEKKMNELLKILGDKENE